LSCVNLQKKSLETVQSSFVNNFTCVSINCRIQLFTSDSLCESVQFGKRRFTPNGHNYSMNILLKTTK